MSSTPCKYGSGCKSVNQSNGCKYYHPRGHKFCKHGERCYTTNCEFKHHGAGLGKAGVTMRKTDCKYGRRCNDMNCKYTHYCQALDSSDNRCGMPNAKFIVISMDMSKDWICCRQH